MSYASRRYVRAPSDDRTSLASSRSLSTICHSSSFSTFPSGCGPRALLLVRIVAADTQWGDSSPLLLPCIRFRDLAVHTIIAATVCHSQFFLYSSLLLTSLPRFLAFYPRYGCPPPKTVFGPWQCILGTPILIDPGSNLPMHLFLKSCCGYVHPTSKPTCTHK